MSQLSSPDVVPVKDNAQGSVADSFFAGWAEARRYKVLEVIGKGSYGVVCAAIDNFTKERVAIKKIQNVFDNVADATRILREIKLLRLLKHPDVVEIKHIMLPPDPRNFKDIYVVFELLESDLHTVIGANDDLTHDHHKVFLYQLLRGLNFIHSSGVVHRDLKPKNILANSNCKLKICDFGLARPFLSDTHVSPVHWTDYVATRWYRAPELCGCFYGRYSQAVDIWSIGCIFAEVLLGKPLFPGRDAVSQLQLITDLLGQPPQHTIDRIGNQKARAFLSALPNKPAKPFEQKFPNASPAALNLLRSLLAFDPADRPSAAQALADPYFQNLPDATLQEPAGFNKVQFEFELRKLDNSEVRALIYQEALMYHPAVQAAFQAQMAQAQAHQHQHVPVPVYTMPGADVEMRQQFKIAEAQQQAVLALQQQQAAMAASLPQFVPQPQPCGPVGQCLPQPAISQMSDCSAATGAGPAWQHHMLIKQQQLASAHQQYSDMLTAEQQQALMQQLQYQRQMAHAMGMGH